MGQNQKWLTVLKDNGDTLLTPYISAAKKVTISFSNGNKYDVTPRKYMTGCYFKETIYTVKKGIEYIDNAPVNWDLFDTTNEKNKFSIKAYVDFSKKLYENGDTLLTMYSHNKGTVDILLSNGDITTTCSNKYQRGQYHKRQTYKGSSGIEIIDNVAVDWSLYKGHEKSRQASVNRIGFVDFIKSLNNNNHILKSFYINNNTKVLVDFGCNHPVGNISPNAYNAGHRCSYCHQEYYNSIKDGFYNEVTRHGDTCLSEYINNYTNVSLRCGECNEIYKPKPSNYMFNKNGCPYCSSSKGEKLISIFLDNNNINYVRQYSFDGCKLKNKLYFDFYIPHLNLAIEYDGIQHFMPVDYFGGIQVFKDTKNRDKVKNKYCIKHNINLLRIPYTALNNVENIIENYIESLATNNKKSI